MGIEHMIDHTMLKADASKDTIIRYCSEAGRFSDATSNA